VLSVEKEFLNCDKVHHHAKRLVANQFVKNYFLVQSNQPEASLNAGNDENLLFTISSFRPITISAFDKRLYNNVFHLEIIQ
jgi:hypothetical protein